MNFYISEHGCNDGYSIPPVLQTLSSALTLLLQSLSAILRLFRMSDHHDDDVKPSQIYPSQSIPVSPQEKISPAPPLEPTTPKDFKASKTSLKDGTTIDKGDLGLEAAQSSTESGSEELP